MALLLSCAVLANGCVGKTAKRKTSRSPNLSGTGASDGEGTPDDTGEIIDPTAPKFSVTSALLTVGKRMDLAISGGNPPYTLSAPLGTFTKEGGSDVYIASSSTGTVT